MRLMSYRIDARTEDCRRVEYILEHDKNSKAASKVLLAGKVGRFVRLCGYVFPGLMILGDYLRGTLSFTEIR